MRHTMTFPPQRRTIKVTFYIPTYGPSATGTPGNKLFVTVRPDMPSAVKNLSPAYA